MFARRTYILLLAFALAALVLLGRLAQVQLLWHDRFDRDAYARAGGNRTVETVRGGIYTRWGTPLAVQEPAFDLGVPYAELDQTAWRRAVARLAGRSPEELDQRVREIQGRVERIRRTVARNNPQLSHVRVVEELRPHRVAEDVGRQAAAAVRADPERYHGLVVMEGTRRTYPNGALAPHVVGRIGAVTPDEWRELRQQGRHWTMSMPVSQVGDRYRMDDRLGKGGVEQAYEDLLRGRRGHVVNRRRFDLLRIEHESVRVPPQRGCDVFLTLREDFQRAANAALERAAGMEAMDFSRGALVILDVRDGAVLAAATYPSYDLATFGEEFARLRRDERSPLLYRPLQAALPTGSVFKIVTATAALEEGAIAPSTTRTCRGRDTFAGRTFECNAQWGHGTLSLVPAIEHSCNVYFYHAGLAAGGRALAEWGRRMGLGVPTGVDLPFERTGQIPDARATFQVVNLSIGQGSLLCTPLQVARMVSVVANGGRLYTPHFLDRARAPDGEVVSRCEPGYTDVPISASTLRAVRRGMELVTGPDGTARAEHMRRVGAPSLEQFRATGKTGTAETGRAGVYHAWFAGYAPADNPKIAFAAVNESTGGHGGSHAAPLAAFALEQVWTEVEAMP
ncbi:MAG: penicillin-binding transpeptidase domain-containing protein [Candidatus Brocadiia bacterium]